MGCRERKVIVKVPHRISGFFEIVDRINGKLIKDPAKIGSRGAGFNLNMFGSTKIIDLKNSLYSKIFINGDEVNEKAETTHFILNYMKNYIKKDFSVEVHHNFDLPVGCGYGASGSGALGTVFGLCRLFNIKISNDEKIKIAHISEVINKTGLGTVCGQVGKGLCVLKDPGIPCSSKRVKIPKDLLIVCGSFGMIHTKSILNDQDISKEIKTEGRNALLEIIENPNISKFMECSIKFVKSTNIIEFLNLIQVGSLIEDLNKLKIIGASMNQLGRSVYAISYKESLEDVKDNFEKYLPKNKIYITSINEEKPINFI